MGGIISLSTYKSLIGYEKKEMKERMKERESLPGSERWGISSLWRQVPISSRLGYNYKNSHL
jgi:hypothetical protein